MTSGKYFNKGVKALDAPDIGHVVGKIPTKLWSLAEGLRDMIDYRCLLYDKLRCLLGVGSKFH
jgi:hypothetical protein